MIFIGTQFCNLPHATLVPRSMHVSASAGRWFCPDQDARSIGRQPRQTRDSGAWLLGYPRIRRRMQRSIRARWNVREGLAGFALIKRKMKCARGIGWICPDQACAQGRHACRRGVKEGSTHASLNAWSRHNWGKSFSKFSAAQGVLQVSTSFRQVSGLGNPVTQHPTPESAWVGWP